MWRKVSKHPTDGVPQIGEKALESLIGFCEVFQRDSLEISGNMANRRNEWRPYFFFCAILLTYGRKVFLSLIFGALMQNPKPVHISALKCKYLPCDMSEELEKRKYQKGHILSRIVRMHCWINEMCSV